MNHSKVGTTNRSARRGPGGLVSAMTGVVGQREPVSYVSRLTERYADQHRDMLRLAGLASTTGALVAATTTRTAFADQLNRTIGDSQKQMRRLAGLNSTITGIVGQLDSMSTVSRLTERYHHQHRDILRLAGLTSKTGALPSILATATPSNTLQGLLTATTTRTAFADQLNRKLSADLESLLPSLEPDPLLAAAPDEWRQSENGLWLRMSVDELLGAFVAVLAVLIYLSWYLSEMNRLGLSIHSLNKASLATEIVGVFGAAKAVRFGTAWLARRALGLPDPPTDGSPD